VDPPSWTARGDAWFARAAAVAATLVGAAGVVGGRGGVAGRMEVAALSAVVIVGFLVAARHRLPTPVLAAWTFAPPIVLALRERGEGTMFLLVVAVSYLVLVEDDRWVRATAGGVAVASPGIVTLLVHPDWGWPFWSCGILFGWLTAEQMRRFRALVAELTATRERLAEQAVHLERRRIAADLHDLVGHSLGVLLLHLTGARRRLRDDPAAAEEALRQAEGIGRAGLAEVRRGVAALRDAPADARAPVVAAQDVPELVARTAAAGTPVTLAVDGDLAGVEPVAGLAVYRVVQESLANAARHAGGAVVTVRVDVRPEAVDVLVRDSGGRPAGGGVSAAGVGLAGMRERVEALGGRLDAGPAGGGWRVSAEIPRTPAPDGPPTAEDRPGLREATR